MNEIEIRSTRILVDLQACQTQDSAKRGVGRYSESLFKAMTEYAAPRQIIGFLSAQHDLCPKLDGLQTSHILYANSLPYLKTSRSYTGGEQDIIGNILYTSYAESVSPDVIHVSHAFEGFGECVATPLISNRSAGQVLSATLYDLIPLRLPGFYMQNADFKKWYLNKLNFYLQADLLLAISESSRQDAIELLGINPEKIVTIMGGVAEYFKPPENRKKTKENLKIKYNLSRPGIILYTGGDDYRKNLIGAFKAYTLLSPKLRDRNQLVIICALEDYRKEFFLAEARKAGLKDDEVRLFGFIPEEDLVTFYGVCDVFFFPSLYEGFGFPVLEAMACGAPTLCGDNSSLTELLDRSDATFDSSSSESIASRLASVLENSDFAIELREYGLERSKLFSWQSTAHKALEAFDNALSRKRNALVQAAAGGVLPRPRMAMLTPLPPCRSGIADYNAEFLPYLAAHFNIDIFIDGYHCNDLAVKSTFRIFDVADFHKVASSYDVILYELGNSEFHSYMLPLIDEFPGVIGLHDAFLSGLMAYLEFNQGEINRFSKEMLNSHGSNARRLFAPFRENSDAVSNAVINLPCTKRVIDNSIGVISHSPFNLKLAREFYPEGWKSPYRIIPQMIKIKGIISQAKRSETKKALGLHEDDFVITTFGHVAWTKCGDKILNAFLNSNLAKNKNCYLIFAGELSMDKFGLTLKKAIHESEIKNRITITGYLSNKEYQRYLNITDVAIQLRTKSRGGTSRTFLDCLASGLPVIVNNSASFKDYPSGVVLKLTSMPSLSEISDALEHLYMNIEKRQKLGDQGLQYVKKNHNPEDIAAQYAAAIHEFINRQKSSLPDSFVNEVAPHIAGLEDSDDTVRTIAETFETQPQPRFERSRLVIDCSHISEHDYGAGIQRTVKEIVKEAYCSSRRGFEAVAVKRVSDHMVLSENWLNKQHLLLPFEVGSGEGEKIEFKPGDNLLMLDASWQSYEAFKPIFIAARRANIPIITVLYDLLPIRLPPGNIVPGGAKWFESWVRKAVAESDSIICISKTVADDLIAFIREKNLKPSGLKIGWWHLGYKQPKTISKSEISKQIHRLTIEPYCLMIGTIEPRKNHALALETFENLWKLGFDLNLVLAGRAGWMVDDLMAKISSHNQLGKRLFFIEAPSESEINFLYKKASMLLFISKGEGFGLPLVEAASYNIPIVCSKIPAFEEIGKNHVLYVDTVSPEKLSTELRQSWELIKSGLAPISGEIAKLSWKDSTENLLNVVIDQKWYKIL